MIKNCYVHIPFCKKICSYCDFCKVFYNEKMVNHYLEALKNEIEQIYCGEKLSTIYIGGGTPSCLSLEQLEKLFLILSRLNKEENVEFTIECNFDSITLEKLKIFQKYGINRLSFGLESISKNKLQILERKESKKKALSVIALCRKMGFSNINIDLIYGVPGENLEILKEDINFVLSLNPEHISTYSLMIEKNTKLAIKNIEYIDDELDFLMYNYICDQLQTKYAHYEISNFAVKGYESRHNLCYWHNEEYYGFGVSAASYREKVRYTNTKSITKYLNNIGSYLVEKVDLSNQMSYEMILGLRLLKGVSKTKFYQKYHKKIEDVFDVSSLLKEQLLEENEDYYYISGEKLYISNEILIHFIKE